MEPAGRTLLGLLPLIVGAVLGWWLWGQSSRATATRGVLVMALFSAAIAHALGLGTMIHGLMSDPLWYLPAGGALEPMRESGTELARWWAMTISEFSS